MGKGSATRKIVRGGRAANVHHEEERSAYAVSSREWRIVALLCFIASLRIFFFGAVFPFFNNVDEPSHFDLIWKYSQWQIPAQGTDRISPESLRMIFLFESPEYFRKAEEFPKGRLPPPAWLLPEAYKNASLKRLNSVHIVNYEEYSPPLYYFVAGRWLAFGESLGLKNGGLLYWTRFLNIPVYALAVLLAFFIGKTIPGSNRSILWGLPTLVAFMPQDVFYSLNSDVLTPLPCGLAYLLMIRIILGKASDWMHWALMGACIAAAVLIKTANVPLLAMLMVVLLVRAVDTRGIRFSRKAVLNASAFCASLVVPLGIWISRNLATVGDWSGSDHKINLLGWTYKSFADIFLHPIFTPFGLGHFLHNTLSSFWRGEFVWGREGIASVYVDYFYSVSTGVFLGVSTFSLVRFYKNRPARSLQPTIRKSPRKKSAAKNDRSIGSAAITDEGMHKVLFLSICGVSCSVAFMIALSMVFDFGNCVYPSREKPFFTSGRLLLCVLYPALLCYIYGLDRIMSRFGNRVTSMHVICALCVLLTLNELYLSGPVFGSVYNFFHIPLGKLGP
ncbi:MAG: hypothetical protein A4E57_03674 [Syntrophorhabdaceae bacterium PtaU1.Bin034]|nr:MAG: hypothetical protein A4E57_03674 [Syntrophorhabdaceae bacterium PtaU1.Bin034]